jgi:cytochrome c5
MSTSRFVSSVLLVVLALALMAGCTPTAKTTETPATTTGGASSTGGGATSAGTGAATELINSKCTVCHTADRITQANKDRAGWEQTVARMRAKGAVLTDTEASQIVDALSSGSK